MYKRRNLNHGSVASAGKGLLKQLYHCKSVGPDLAKFLHLGKMLKVFGHFLKVYLVFGKMCNYFGKFVMLLGNFSVL